MISKLLENAILGLQAAADPTGTTTNSTATPADQPAIDAANQAGGKDNIAVILARVSGHVGASRAWWPFKR